MPNADDKYNVQISFKASDASGADIFSNTLEYVGIHYDQWVIVEDALVGALDQLVEVGYLDRIRRI